jgi:hypothetical protein
VVLSGRELRDKLRAPAGVLAPAPGRGTSAITELATRALHDASRCITYASNTQMSDLAAAKFTIALALLSDTQMCREPADCAAIGKACDTALGVCMAWGTYCDDHRDCDVSNACSNHRCAPRSSIACTGPSACHPDDSCDPGSGRCIRSAVVDARHQACYVPSAVGPCAAGELRSVDRMVRCVQTTLAQPETCDGVDNNCNGTIDEGLATAERCIAPGQRGECANGRRVCQGGGWACTPAAPTPETCDGKDNDCDGQIDDGIPAGGVCTAIATGECRNGAMACRNGRMECVPGAPKSEVCDGKDNNCNGACDEGTACGEELVFEQLDERHSLFGLSEEHDYGDACGKDAYGRQRYRVRCEAKDDWERSESHCEPHDTGFGGWLNSDNTSCRCRVHFGSRGDHHVRCRVKIYARPAGCIGTP